MTIMQTVEIPVNHRLTIDILREIPAGKTVLILKPASEAFDRIKTQEAIENCSGLARRMGLNFSNVDFLAMRRKEKELEERLDSGKP